jgi:VanZ family protein
MQLPQNQSGDKDTLLCARHSMGPPRFFGIKVPPRIIGWFCLITVCATLGAGLWPFCAPENEVIWLNGENAIRFGRHGTALSSGRIDFAGSKGTACSVELWVQPARTWTTGSILAFYDSADRRQLILEQDYTDLVLSLGDGDRRAIQRRLWVGDVFREQQAFLSVTSDGQETSVYVNGQLALTSPDFQLSSKDLSGQLILANSPLRNHSWPGEVKGLAIYGSELDTPQVLGDYQDWTQLGEPRSRLSDRALALYLFREQGGRIIHSAVPSGINLEIPKRFLVVDQRRFESPLTERHSDQNYRKDIQINVAGFVPLGFVVSLYFVAVRRIKHAAVATILVGATVSFAIEYGQSFLPTRLSGLTDIFTNILGTTLGVLLYSGVSRFAGYRARVEPL